MNVYKLPVAFRNVRDLPFYSETLQRGFNAPSLMQNNSYDVIIRSFYPDNLQDYFIFRAHTAPVYIEVY